jgi:hypothetical protein
VPLQQPTNASIDHQVATVRTLRDLSRLILRAIDDLALDFEPSNYGVLNMPRFMTD